MYRALISSAQDELCSLTVHLGKDSASSRTLLWKTARSDQRETDS